MNKILLWILTFSFSVAAWSCPYCNSLSKDKTPYMLIVVGIFILLTYIPFYILFRAAKKYDPKQLDGNE